MGANNDGKYFTRDKVQTLRAELNSGGNSITKRKTIQKKLVALKKIVANMTMGNDMGPLFGDVVSCNSIPNLEVSYAYIHPAYCFLLFKIKKMVFLFLTTYAKTKPGPCFAV